jgi:hypothetical protein
VDGESHCDADRDGGNRQQRAQRVGAPLTEEQPPH